MVLAYNGNNELAMSFKATSLDLICGLSKPNSVTSFALFT
jgi:hypothetical protein